MRRPLTSVSLAPPALRRARPFSALGRPPNVACGVLVHVVDLDVFRPVCGGLEEDDPTEDSTFSIEHTPTQFWDGGVDVGGSKEVSRCPRDGLDGSVPSTAETVRVTRQASDPGTRPMLESDEGVTPGFGLTRLLSVKVYAV